MNSHNYQNLILIEKINKKEDLLICIPTYNSYEITKKTIIMFKNQQNVNFDILITGPSGDIELLTNDFNDLNFIVSKENYGHAGHELINIYIAKKYNYDYVVLNDNDSRLMSENGLSQMLHNIKSRDLLVTFPLQYLVNYSQNIDNEFVDFCPFHTCLFSKEILNQIKDPFYLEYFVSFDDVSFLLYLKKFKSRIKSTNTHYTHPSKPYKFFNYNTMFYQTRSYLIFMLYDRASFKEKFYFLILFRPHWYIPLYLLYSIFNLDFTYFKLLAICIYQVFTKKYQNLNFKNPKYTYKEICNPENKELFKSFNLFTDVIFPKKHIKHLNEYGDEVYLLIQEI